MSRSNFFYKTIFSFIFFLPCIVFSQSISTYNKDNFLEQLNKDFNALGIQLTEKEILANTCLLYTSPSPRDRTRSRMPSSA